jgi:signal transduction histidine kinase
MRDQSYPEGVTEIDGRNGEVMTKLGPPEDWSNPSAISRYAIAAASVALALLGSHLAVSFLHAEPLASVFLCAILFAAWFGGLGPGLFAAALALFAFYIFLLPPIHSFIAAVSELPRLVLLGVTAVFVCLLSAAQRRTADSLRRSRDQLQAAIGDQSRTELNLRLNEMYLAEAQRISNTGSFAWNYYNGDTFWSEEMFRLLALDKTETPGLETFYRRVHPDDRAFVQNLIAGLSDSDASLDYECRLLMPDRTVKYIHVLTGRTGRELAGRYTMIGTVMDVTERTMADSQLKQNEAFLAEAQRVSRTGSFAYKRSNGENVWSDETYRIFEIEPEDFPTIELALQRVHPDDRAFLQARYDETIGGDAPTGDYEYRLLMPDGRIKHIRTLRGAVGPKFADTFSVIGTVMDVTERKQAEEALRKAQADLAHAARVATLGELTATIAHEVNQPLAGVVSSGNACLRWLANEPPNIENAKQSANRIVRDAHRASEVIGRVRSLAKKSPPEKEWLNINEAVLETLGLTRIEAAQNRASLRTQLSDEIQAVWADKIEVQQVILNLIMNAIEAVSAPGNEQRDVLVVTARTDAGDISLTVKDTGAGLDPAKLEHIFDAFYTTKREGMGMGLAVSRSIIEAHGGRLWASPNQPRGAVFQFTLPSIRDEAS